MPFEETYEEDLVPRIRDLIDGYSKDSILKEYLQNADDSKATELIVTYDNRTHGNLNGTIFCEAKNPALLLYNNSKFEQSDFKSIVKISDQGKAEDAKSTGRFGQGFSSSFSVSDHPSFISNGKALWFDVLKKAVSKEKNKRSIQGWKEEEFSQIQPWLDTFSPACNDFNGTIFRLPLRTEETAKESKISHEIFLFDDFIKWCDEWKNNTSGLLFLRHIQRLVLQEIDDNGKLITHVEINTKNSAEIKKINDEIQKEFSNSLLDICSLWKAQDKTLPFFKYKHHFIVKHLNRENNEYEEYKESWAVVNGLFRGTDNGLINQAVQVLSISPNLRKVLPWTGVAILLDHKERPQKPKNSNYYTFLPLPIKSKHPVQIHGWFDLNPKRTEITHDGAGDDKEILIEWNKQLFKEGVGVAWAYLIDYIKKTCPNNSYYTLWPKNNDDHFDEYLLTGFYNKISELECLKTSHKNNTQWNTPKDDNIFYLQSGLDKNLFNAFREHFYLITYKPSQNVIKGLAGVDVDLQEIKPKFIREFLLEEAAEVDFPVSLNDVPIKMLSQRKWLLAILIFCAEAEDDAEDDADYGYLDELPLQITSDNKLYQLGDHCLVDEEPNFAIFDGNKALFLDARIVKIVKDAEVLPSSWYQPTLKNYLTVLHEHIDEYDLKDKEWLENLIALITSSDEKQVDEAIDELHQLQVVYLNDSSFGFLESKIHSPVLVSNEESSNIPLLAKTGMPLVHPDYIDIYSPLIKLKGVDLITKLTPFSLINYLVNILQDEYSFFKERELREYLVDFIAQDISWFDKLVENELEWLNDMPFIATESGKLFSKTDDKKLYLPAGFKPPENIQSLQGEYELIKVVDENQQALYKRMGFEEQNPVNYLEGVIIPFVEDSSHPEDDVKSILEWLANEWEQLTSKINEEEKDKLIYKLSESTIILNSDNNLKKASDYYHPHFFSKLPPLLQYKKYSPLTFDSDKTQNNWKNLLSLLGSSQEIIPQHIVYVVELISEVQDHKRTIKLLNYISNHFEWFDDMQYQSKPIFEHLSDLAWIPAEKSKEILRPSDEYEVLRKPSEIILAKDYMIAGGCHYSLSSEVKLGKKDGKGEFSKREMAQKIKLLVSLPTSSVFDSFLLLRDIAINDQEKKISDYAKAFYKYIGRFTFDEIPDDIKEQSIFIMGRWLPSNKVFQSPPAHLSGIFSWDELVKSDGIESQLSKGLITLGVLDRPDNNYLIRYLHNIPQTKKLNGQQLKESKAILKHFQDNIEDLEDNDIPLISRSDQLINCSDLYIKDLHAYKKSEKKNDQLEFCKPQFEKLAKHCHVVSLADSVKPQLDTDNNQGSEVDNNRWNDYIRSDPFKLAVLRLIYHEGKISDDEIKQESIDEVLPSKVLLMDRLVVNYYINETWIYDDVEASTFQDTENSILYLLNQDDEEDMCDSIASFISDSSKLSRDSFSLIGRILRRKLHTSEEIQNLLDNKKIKSLPEKIEIDEGISLYGDNTESSNNDLDDSTSHDEDIEQDDSSSDDYNQESEQPPSGNYQNSEDNSPENNVPKESDDEIPPPTKPKQPGSQDAIDTSSSDHNSNIGNSDHNWHEYNANRGSQSGAGGNRGGSSNSQDSSRSKKSSNSNPVSPNNRMSVYVGKEKELDKERTDEERKFAKNIGNKGENYVLDHSKDYLLSTSNKFIKAATDNNKGYDITEVDSSGEIVRYIEVKTLTGKWGEGGVGITESQLEFAQVYDNWWLFVVENINTENTRIHILENPVLQANRFMFDHSWKQLAVEAEGAKNIYPQAGEKYLLPNGVYEILSVVPMGILFKVKLKHIQSNETVTKKFDPSWEKC